MHETPHLYSPQYGKVAMEKHKNEKTRASQKTNTNKFQCKQQTSKQTNQ